MISVCQKMWCYLTAFWIFRCKSSWSVFVWCLTELIGLACVGPKAESGSEGPFCFSIDMKPCWSQYLSFLPLLGRWRPSSLYSSLCDTAGVCIFLFCSSSPSPLFSSCHLLPLSFHCYLSCTHFFLWRKKKIKMSLHWHILSVPTHTILPLERPALKRRPGCYKMVNVLIQTKRPPWKKVQFDMCFATCLSPKSMFPQLAQAQHRDLVLISLHLPSFILWCRWKTNLTAKTNLTLNIRDTEPLFQLKIDVDSSWQTNNNNFNVSYLKASICKRVDFWVSIPAWQIQLLLGCG